jgi:hypothetical protein
MIGDAHRAGVGIGRVAALLNESNMSKRRRFASDRPIRDVLVVLDRW